MCPTIDCSRREVLMPYDVVIAGGGPAGLAAALALGRGRKRVLLCDAGPRRNAAASHMHNFVTRDGTPPAEFRHIAREQLEPYRSVEVRDVRIEEIRGERGAFDVRLATGAEQARRVLLCTGMVDEVPGREGFRELWGASLFQCPYCHGWEVRGQRFGYLAASAEAIPFALFLRGWTSDVVLLTDGTFAVPPESAASLAAAGVRLEERRIARLRPSGDHLEAVEFSDGGSLPRDVLFMHPPQRQVDLVLSLGLALDAKGYVQVDETQRETSRPGIYAGGDLVMEAQGALLAAASGMQAAARLNHALTLELAAAGALP
jgi:thioredoxin reductase